MVKTMAKNTRQSQRTRLTTRRRIAWSLGLVAFIALALVCKVIHWRVINAIPPGRLETPAMPSPNGYDYYLRAEQLLAAPALDGSNALAPTDVLSVSDGHPHLSQIEPVLSANRAALGLIETGMRYPAVAPAPRYALGSWERPYALWSRQDRLLRVLELDALDAQASGEWHGAADRWLRTMRFADAFPDTGPHYDSAGFKATSRMDGCMALLTVIPHLNRQQTSALMTELAHEDSISIAGNRRLQIEKGYNDQAMLALFRNRNWRRTWPVEMIDDYRMWSDPADIEVPSEPLGLTRARLYLYSNTSYLKH